MESDRTMTDRPFGGIPPTLIYELEDGIPLGSCDWGRCNGEQVGWAVCGIHDEVGDDEWLAICAECLGRGASKDGEHIVSASWTFEQISERYPDLVIAYLDAR